MSEPDKTQAGINRVKTEQELLGYAGPDRIVSSKEFWEIQKDRPRTERQFKSGLSTLDEKCEGFESGEVWVVSGPTGNGKTLLCDTVGRHFIATGTNVLWFSFEVLPEKFLAKYKEAGDPVVFVPLTRVTNNLKWLERRVFEAKLKYDCRIVFIDHLHFVADFERIMKNQSLEIGTVMRFLKSEIALKHNVCVFLVAHMAKIQFENEPSINDIRDSSFIAQEADGVLIVYRKPEERKKKTDPLVFTNKARVIIDKARRSGVMKWRIDVLKVGDDIVEADIFGEPITSGGEEWNQE